MSVKESPILFSSVMVRALLDGRKSQTRRVVKPQPDIPNWMNWIEMEPKNGLARFRKVAPDWPDDSSDDIYCRYGQPGDRLWVRELWASEGAALLYKADLTDEAQERVPAMLGLEWRNPLYMPREISRITLEITGIRIERLQEISKADAVAEGIERINVAEHWAWRDYTGNGQLLSPRMSYQSLWESINGPESWESNPWVWVIEFAPEPISET